MINKAAQRQINDWGLNWDAAALGAERRSSQIFHKVSFLREPLGTDARLLGHLAAATLFLFLSSQLAQARFTQQGPKLVGTGDVGGAQQGYSVALSADGNTAIVGGPADTLDSACRCSAGAAWVFTRNNGVWTQQGGKLVGTGAVGNAGQGVSVALSADGNTAIVGGPGDNPNGAVWVYTRSGGVWAQQGGKLAGTVLTILQGTAVDRMRSCGRHTIGRASDVGVNLLLDIGEGHVAQALWGAWDACQP